MTSHAHEVSGKEWIKSFSKKYQKDYWYNSVTKETSWTYPTKIISIGHQKSIESNDIPTPSSSSSSVASKKRSSEYVSENEPNKIIKSLCSSSSDNSNQGNKVAIIVPFRDLHKEQKRKDQLLQFLPKMVLYLQESTEIASFRIFIIEQSDDGRKFNRGKLLNIGYELAKRAGFEVFIFHDVDLIPSSDDLLPYYSRIPEGKHPCHIARVWNRYSVNQSYFGGIVSFSSSQFEAVNGFPNNFWGWGGEDDELYYRITDCELIPSFPSSGTIIDLEEMTLDEKLATLRSNTLWKCMNKSEVLLEHTATWSVNGISDLNYQLLGSEFSYDGCVIVCSVDVGLNDHWTDLVCKLEDRQMNTPVEQLKRRFDQMKETVASEKK